MRRQRTDSDRYADYDRLLEAFNGYQWTGKPREGEVRLTFNYLKTVVVKGAGYLMGQPVAYQVRGTRYEGRGPGNAGGRWRSGERLPDVEAYLALVGKANRLAGLDLEAAISAGVLGDGAFTVRWDPGSG